MKQILVGIVLGILLVFGLLKIGTPLIAEQNRFELHGIFDGERGYGPHLVAVCDTGNGVMGLHCYD
jgi:hypothetical protein